MSKKTYARNKDGLIVLDDGTSVNVSGELYTRKMLLVYYNHFFFNKFMSRVEADGISYQQKHYIVKKLWFRGTIGCFMRKGWKYLTSDSWFAKHPEDAIVFAPWVMYDRFNIYDFPVSCTFVNTRAVKFIPTTPFKIDEEAVIGYIQHDHRSIFDSIKVKILQIVDIEMTMRTNLKSQKYPWLFSVAPEDEQVMKNLIDNLDDDAPYLYAALKDIKNAKALTSGAPFTLDKLQNLLQCKINDVLTYLGVNNVGILEKKEHTVVDEVNANNQEIEESSDQFDEHLREFSKRIQEVLKYDKINLRMKKSEIITEEPFNEEDNSNDEDNQ